MSAYGDDYCCRCGCTHMESYALTAAFQARGPLGNLEAGVMPLLLPDGRWLCPACREVVRG